MSQFHITYQHRDRELTKEVTAFSEEEARAIFKHNFRGISPLSVEQVDFAPERKPAARNQPRRPFRRPGTEAEMRGIANDLRAFRERFAATKQ